MSGLRSSVQSEIKDNMRGSLFTDTTATILSYDKTNETCQIKYLNPNGDGYVTRGNVPIANTSGGVAYGAYYTGQKCSISFINGNANNPIIRGVETSYYENRSCSDQGAFIANDEIWKVGKPEHIIAMTLDWMDDSNSNLSKYESAGCHYTDFDVDQKSMDMITTLDKFDDTEVGMTNLSNHSTIRCKDNGDIDIFTSSNTGIRICKTGNIKLYGIDVEFTNAKTEMTDRSIATPLKVAQVMKICLAYDIIKEVDSYITTMREESGASTLLNGDGSGTSFQDIYARIQSYENLRHEFYETDMAEIYTEEEEDKDKYITLFRQFNDEFLDTVGELAVKLQGVVQLTSAGNGAMPWEPGSGEPYPGGGVTPMPSSEAGSLLDLAKSFIGCTYKWGAEGEISDSHGLCFDCSGFITYLMKAKGLMPQGASRLTVSTIPNSGYFYEVPWNSRQPGDVITNSAMTHVVLYEGNDQIIHASNSAPYPKGGVKEGSLYFPSGRVFRMKGYGVE